MLKHLPDKYLKNIRKHFLFSEKVVIYTAGVDKRPNNDNDDDKGSDDNIDERIAKFTNQIKDKFAFDIFATSEKLIFPQKLT